MAQRPTYFLAPPRSYQPIGPIRLGAVIPSPKLPDEPIYVAAVPPCTSLSNPDPNGTTTSTQIKWKASRIKRSSQQFGVWTSFLQMVVGVGIDAAVERAKAIKLAWEVEEMRTESFVPSMQWLEDLVKIPIVKERKRIFVITGIMIATNMTCFRQELSGRGWNLSLGVDFTAFTGVPVSTEPRVGRESEEGVSIAGMSEGDTVFAFQVREVRVRRKGGVKEHRVVTKSALFSQERNKEDEEEDADKAVEVEGLSEELTGKEFDLETTVVKQATREDEGEGDVEEVMCVMPEDVWLDDLTS
ncbi:hypothetical protein BDW02DRAFT_216124 [Decorospora gaudefroyi]|uniref:Uncharacterized protein n=1 Tax=Decorospora gaudefroyi TaxID=184978 RepID=A0A6A5K587_9PLEO|nr:hypothetical protein BDW02DRAFT_216124 [Decorospora gaudefroyi]